MHPALERDVRVRNRSGQDLAQSTKVERILGRHPSATLHYVLQLLEDSVLEDRIDHQDEGGEDAREQCPGTFLAEEIPQGLERRTGLLGTRARQSLLGFILPRCHPRVDDPDRVREEDCCTSRKCASDHGLNGRELLRGTTRLYGCLLKGGSGPFVPVVVYKVGHTDAKQGGLKACIESANSLPLDNAANGIQRRRLGALRLDLRPSR